MKKIVINIFFLFLLLFGINFHQTIFSQSFQISTSKGLGTELFIGKNNQKYQLYKIKPIFSFEVNDSLYNSTKAFVITDKNGYEYDFGNGITGRFSVDYEFLKAWKANLLIKNNTEDTLDISNIVPFGQLDEHIYITASGPWALARTKIFRPNLGPVGVILPDNAWEMGYCAFKLDEYKSVCAIARRGKAENATKRRYKTVLYPGGSVNYTIYADKYSGKWQNGLKLMFSERYLFDLEKFDNSLFEREDLNWIRNKYLMTLQFAWDQNYYDWEKAKYNFKEFLEEGKKYFGGYDIFGIWPTWPALGVDQRNQWDLYEDLPGGLNKMKELSEYAKKNGMAFFIEYNPWDKSTRKEDPYEGMARLIEAVNADGVVLDCHGSSSEKLQKAADSIKPGVIMYSEGMAVVKDMPGIISGRVHDAIFMPPPLNLNKLIKPDFAIFRVCQLSQGRIHREIAVSFFNGIGIELNTFAPGRPDWMDEEYKYLGRTTKLLRENTLAFNSLNWTPLIKTLRDSIWVNKWPAKNKTIYTIYSLIPEGIDSPLFEENISSEYHFVSLWNHEELLLDTIYNKTYVQVKTNAFDKSWLGTRREGNIDCIAKFRNLLKVDLNFDTLIFQSDTGTKISVYAGNPSYQTNFKDFTTEKQKIKLYDIFGRYEGKFVVQLFDKNELIDERIVFIKPGTPRLISKVIKTKFSAKPLKNMLEIPAGEFIFKIEKNWSFIPYPYYSEPQKIKMNSFYMDKYPVTNKQFYKFIKSSKYIPEDTTNFLNHWKDAKYPKGEENYPVVYVSYKDAQAYAEWAGKRLPTEIEWQYASQGFDGRKWPWGNGFDSTKCNNALGYPTPVNAFNSGKSPFGIMDMVGNVWQLTNDVYDNGSYYFVIMRGGSYYKPTSSWWYVQGGPQQLDKSQMLLLVSPGFIRNATVGFRCVKDNFRE